MAAKTDDNNLDLQVNVITLDLGTRNLICRVNQQTVFDGPSCIVFDTENGQVVIGQDALLMKEKTPANKIYREPMANGVISDLSALIALLTEIFVNIVKVHDVNLWEGSSIWERSVVLVAIPSKVYRLDRTVLIETLQGKHEAKISIFSEKWPRYRELAKNPAMKAEKVVIVPEVILAAIGAGKPIWSAQGVFILDIGGGTSDCAVISAGNVINQDSIPVAGNAIDRSIQAYFEKMHYLAISAEEAERTKMAAGLWLDGEKDSEHKITVYGKSTKTSAPEKIVIPKKEVALVVNTAFEPIIELCSNIIMKSGPSFSRTLQENGLIVSGGGALLQNVVTFLSKKLDLEHVAIANEPQKCVIKGTEAYEMHKIDLYEKGFIRPSK